MLNNLLELNNILDNSKVLLRVLFVALITVPGLAACGGGGSTTITGSSSTSNSGTGINPSVSLSAASTSVPYNSGTTISWSSSNSTSCTSSGGGGTGTTGTFNTGALTTTKIYTVTCVGTGNQQASASITVDVAPSPTAVTVSVSAVSTSVPYNSGTTISWSSNNSTSCTSSGGGGTGTTGTFNTGALTTTSTYTVTCTGPSGSASKSLTITVASSAVSSAISQFLDAGGGNVTVTSVNNLNNGSIISISGTTNYNGTYTVANRTSTSFAIVHAFLGNDATGVWQVGGSMIAGCSTTGATGAISLSNIPSRFNGVAPLSIFFDATGTTATTTTKPFQNLEYRWNFGENTNVLAALPGGANWTNGSTHSSRNMATGPVAAHVYETPGSYIVSVSATDGTNTVSNSCAQIIVQDPDTIFAGTNTICFSATGNFTGCPSGANQVTQSNYATAINTYNAPGKRLLFHRGETFPAGTTIARIGGNGPGLIGAYGSGTAPKFTFSGALQAIKLSGDTTPGIGDWRMMDIEMAGPGVSQSHAIEIDGTFNQFTALRLNIHDWARGIAAPGDILDYWDNHGHPGHTAVSEWVIQDTISTNINTNMGDWRLFLSGNKIAAMGNYLDGQNGGSHVIRGACLDKAIISNNYIAHAGSTQHNIKLHAIGWSTNSPTCNPGGAGKYTEHVLIADNEIVGYNNAWTVSLGPQNAQSDERLRNIIVERNWFKAGPGQGIAMESSAADSTYRNNIIDMTGAPGHIGIDVTQRGVEPAPSNVQVYNNTIYDGDTIDFAGVRVISGSSNITVMNNLGVVPSAAGQNIVVNNGSSGFVGSNNLLSNSPSNIFISGNPALPADYGLKPLPNYARDTGSMVVPVLSDFFNTSRPQNGVTDIGAVEGP